MKTLQLALLVVPALSPVLACGGSSDSNSSNAGSGSGGETQVQGDAGTRASGGSGGTASSNGSSGQGGAVIGTAGLGGATGGSGNGGAGRAAGGSGGQAHAGTGGQNTGGAAQSGNPACLKPAGSDVLAADYVLPTGCVWRPQSAEGSFTITDEAAFQQTLGCPANVSSGIDFANKRLRVEIYPAAGSALRTFAIETSDSILVGLSATSWCGGAAPPNQVTLSLLPAGPKPISESLCTSGCNFGSGGFPP